MILGPVGISKYGIGLSSESWTKNVSQKLQLKSDLTLETAIQIARQEMVKSQVTDQNSLASKNVDEIQSKKTPVSSRWRKGKGKKKGFIPKTKSKEVWQMRSPSHKARTVFRKR